MNTGLCKNKQMTGSINLVHHNMNNSAMLNFFSVSITETLLTQGSCFLTTPQMEDRKTNQGLTLSLMYRQAEADGLG